MLLCQLVEQCKPIGIISYLYQNPDKITYTNVNHCDICKNTAYDLIEDSILHNTDLARVICNSFYECSKFMEDEIEIDIKIRVPIIDKFIEYIDRDKLSIIDRHLRIAIVRIQNRERKISSVAMACNYNRILKLMRKKAHG